MKPAYILLFAFVLILSGMMAAQVPPPSATATPEPAIKISRLLAANLEKTPPGTAVSKENAVKAYTKLLEGERHLWAVKNARGRRSQAMMLASVRSARLAFQEALDANPRLAEAYTALAELAITAPPTDVDEAIELANLATKIDKNNFGARRILARLFTFKSGLGTRALDNDQASRAVEEWRFVASLDPRNAEAWAFLSEFYELQGKPTETIQALEKWRSSAAPIDSQFYQRITGGRQSLAPESATLKLGEAFLKNGRITEAIDTLSVVIADDPDNEAAVDMLREAVQSSKGSDAAKATQALQQAVYANPANASLVNLLAEVYAKNAQLEQAEQLLSTAAKKLLANDRPGAAAYYVSLGDLYARADKYAEATAAFEKAISARGLDKATTLDDDERGFVIGTFERMIRAAKNANRPQDAIAFIERVRKLLGPDDEFANIQLIALHREAGKRQEAVAVIKSLRAKRPRDESLARLEATLLAELGKVDEAVEGYQKYITSRLQPAPATPTGEKPTLETATDMFSNYLFITNLYSQAGRGKQAVEAANQALAAASGAERKQIARLSLASALQMSGDFAGAENTLRDILKESPGNPIAMNNLGYFLLERDIKYDEAIKLIKEAVETDPTNPSYLDSLGWAYFKTGKLDDAEKYLKDALRLDSASSTIHEHLGDVHAKQGKTDLAMTQWQRALDRASDPADVARLKTKLKK